MVAFSSAMATWLVNRRHQLEVFGIEEPTAAAVDVQRADHPSGIPNRRDDHRLLLVFGRARHVDDAWIAGSPR